jgi:4'-phosphopantetheinyl transferase
MEEYEGLMSNYLPQFPENYQKRVKALRLKEDIIRTLTGRKMLQRALTIINIQTEFPNIEYSDLGKPKLKGELIDFNISHSNEMVVCAVALGVQIGIDIEYIQKIKIANFKNMLTTPEWFEINSANDSDRTFYDIWTKKEAALKTHGSGLHLPLKSVKLKRNCAIIYDNKYRLTQIDAGCNYCCHLATSSNSHKLKIIHI